MGSRNSVCAYTTVGSVRWNLVHVSMTIHVKNNVKTLGEQAYRCLAKLDFKTLTNDQSMKSKYAKNTVLYVWNCSALGMMDPNVRSYVWTLWEGVLIFNAKTHSYGVDVTNKT